MHHRLPGQSSQNEASATVANAVLALQHNEHVSQHHVGAVCNIWLHCSITVAMTQEVGSTAFTAEVNMLNKSIPATVVQCFF